MTVTGNYIEKEEIESKYLGIDVSLDHESSFSVKTTGTGNNKPDVPLRRFGFINKKIREFLLRESADNIKIMDFNDGLGKVYAYKWKNKGGWVSFYAKFLGDGNIEIPQGSSVSSRCFIFANKGNITLKNSNLIDTQIWTNEGTVTIENSDMKDCYIFGSISIKDSSFKERSRFFTKSAKIEQCEVSGNHLFYQDDLDLNGTLNLSQVVFSGSTEISGSVTAEISKISDFSKISGNVNLSQCEISGNTYIHSGVEGSINLSQCECSDYCVIVNSVSASQSQFSGNCFVGDSSNLLQTQVSENAIILGNSSLINCKVKGNALINMNSQGIQTTYSDFAVQTGSTIKLSGSISGNGILSGEGTSHKGSLEGRVFGGVACTHSVGEGERHWDQRSCLGEEQKFTLIDEREEGITPGAKDCSKEQKDKPTIC